jgi:tetratricopeptide (TPR) repeat protein
LERGEAGNGERLYAAAIQKAESFGEPDLRLARSLTRLGLFYREVAPLLGRPLSGTEKAVPPGDPRLVPVLNGLGAVWLGQGQASAAELLIRRAMAIADKAFGPDDPSTAASMANLAAVYQGRACFAEAEPLYRNAFRIYEKDLGPPDPAVVSPLSGLGGLCREPERYREPEPIYRQALSIVAQATRP